MSLKINAGAVARPVTVATYTVPATITSNSGLTVTPNVPFTPTPVFKNVVATSTKTTYRDNPGVSSAQMKNFLARGQYESLRSAAVNTAIAFGLDPVRAADFASHLQQQYFQADLRADSINLDVVIIPK